MTRLRTADLEAVLSFLEEAQGVDGPEPLTAELLDRLVEIVGCTYASYSEIDQSARVERRYVRCSAEPYVPTDEGWWEWPRSVELRRYRSANGSKPVVVLSDVVSRADRTSADFNYNFHHYGLPDEMQVDLDPARPWFATVNLGGERDFGPRERLMAHVLRPHLTGLCRSAELRQRLAAAPATFDLEALDRLTRREREVMVCVADGLTDAEIASVLVVQRGTVRKHLEHIFEKLGVRSRTAALAKLRASGLPAPA
jgi:DNA-binding CsgD family transcriptional regulator